MPMDCWFVGLFNKIRMEHLCARCVLKSSDLCSIPLVILFFLIEKSLA